MSACPECNDTGWVDDRINGGVNECPRGCTPGPVSTPVRVLSQYVVELTAKLKALEENHAATLAETIAVGKERIAQLLNERDERNARAESLDLFNVLRRHGLYGSPAYRELAERYEKLRTGPAWEDRPLPEDDAIRAAHPMRTDRHDLYAEAARLVGAKRSKYALVDLVNWLLSRAERR